MPYRDAGPGATAIATGGQNRPPSAKGTGREDSLPPLWLQQQAEVLQQCGPRALGELLAEFMVALGPEFAPYLRRKLNRPTAVPVRVYRALETGTFLRPPQRRAL